MRYIIFFIFLNFFNINSQSNFGSPSDPTYNNFQNEIPQNYYEMAVGESGDNLKEILHQIISNHIVYPYTDSNTDTWDIIMNSDQDPSNHDNMILVYTNRSHDKSYRDIGTPPGYQEIYSQFENGNGNRNNSWNREHIWPKSHGFPSSDDVAYTDLHNLKPCDHSVNNSRGNKDFDNGGSQHNEANLSYFDSDSWEPPDFVKGDIARILFYMVVRYDPGYTHDNNPFDLELVDFTTPGSSDPILGKLSTLLEWHDIDPVDDFERNRNEVIYSYQLNRNPFIDYPNLVNFLWGENFGENWNEILGLENITDQTISLFPIPSIGILNFSRQLEKDRIEIISIKGDKVYDQVVTNSNSINFNLEPGFYFLKISNEFRVINSKIIIK